ncbi:S-layer-like y domain-containing protein [Paenibacillus sediminis]|uniref:SLH domain-containing protein n=1 Tax=Paenibacillus sediminis TaxID=664909 RepID=A0ABS4H1C3_9BACL|nr:S-layer homology domain-containing protein [Paenibacillus sediminis]MBP1936330.1 hypothetical protein [Paenibacillus sediminis]
MEKKKTRSMAAFVVICSMMFASSVSAFSDVTGQQQQKIVESLQSQGIIQGVSDDKFAPNDVVTTAQAYQLAVKAFKLQTVKSTSSSDIKWKKVPENAWYAESLRIAAQNGVPVPADIDPLKAITKEEFARIVYKALSATTKFPMIRIYVPIADESDINSDNMGSIQALLTLKIAQLDEKNQFHPQQNITRMEAATIIYNAIEFVNSHQDKPVQDSKEEVTYTVEKASDSLNKVVLIRSEQPNPGYGISIAKVEYTGDNKAIIYYELTSPEPGQIYVQVITKAKVETFISNQYKVIEIRPFNKGTNGITK